MTAKYSITEDDEFSGATIHIKGKEPFVVSSSHPDWKSIRNHLLDRVDDDDLLVNMISPIKGVSEGLTRLSERFSIKGTTIFLDGDPLVNSLTQHILNILRETGIQERNSSYERLVRFAEKLYTNPSKDSIEHLFHFLDKHRLTITEDGDFVAYKGINADFGAKTSGPGIVDGIEYDSSSHLPNTVGAIVEMPRSKVDTNRARACSVGLHAGNYRYANDFAGRDGVLVNVAINPRDVVSVPSDSNDEKLRVSRYRVIEVNAGRKEIDSVNYTVPVAEVVPEAEVEETKPKVQVTVTQLKAEKADVAPATKHIQTDSEWKQERLDHFADLIPTLNLTGSELRRYRNKKISAKSRPVFDEAVQAAGLSY